MRLRVRSILFKQMTEINARALSGLERGQYDVRLTRSHLIAAFTDAVPSIRPTSLGGWERQLPISPFDGPNPVPERIIRLRYMGPDSQRQDYYFPSQSTVPYDLWAPGRAFRTGTKTAALQGDVVLLIRDVHDNYHARWIRSADVPKLPEDLRRLIRREKTGVYEVPDTAPMDELSPVAGRVLDALRRHYNVLLYGPPATGKTHIVGQVRRHFQESGIMVDTENERQPLTEVSKSVHSSWATFHQSYSYEDFLVGLRPDPLEKGGFKLVAVPGVLLELSEWARSSSRSSLLVIDEINRGNVSRIFGEFITLMEPDKRLDENGAPTTETVEVRLPFVQSGTTLKVTLPDQTEVEVPSPFTMPRRVFTLATMNSVDKSVAPLDAALRRRFHVIDLSPDLQSLSGSFGLDPNKPIGPEDAPQQLDSADSVRALALTLLAQLNRRISMFLGADFQFGQWFLQPLQGVDEVNEAKRLLAGLWRTSLLPQLEEYFVGRTDQLLGLLGDPPADAAALLIETPPPALADLGAVTSVRGRPGTSDDDILTLLTLVASSA